MLGTVLARNKEMWKEVVYEEQQYIINKIHHAFISMTPLTSSQSKAIEERSRSQYLKWITIHWGIEICQACSPRPQDHGLIMLLMSIQNHLMINPSCNKCTKRAL